MAFISTGIGKMHQTATMHAYIRNYPASPLLIFNSSRALPTKDTEVAKDAVVGECVDAKNP